MLVVGAGVIGVEYASMFAALGSRVTLVESASGCSTSATARSSRACATTYATSASPSASARRSTAVERARGRHPHHARERQARSSPTSCSTRPGARGRRTRSSLQNAGLEADARGRIAVGADFRTAVENIFAAGDVIGGPGLAATSMEQGRLAAAHAFGEAAAMNELIPVGIYTIPEIAYVGRNEEQLTAEAIPYEVGVSRYRELARGQILGDSYGMLKLLVSPEDHLILGVHALGTNATEVIHIGQAVMGCGGTIGFLVDSALQLPDARRVVQSSRPRRAQQAARGRAHRRRSVAASDPKRQYFGSQIAAIRALMPLHSQ